MLIAISAAGSLVSVIYTTARGLLRRSDRAYDPAGLTNLIVKQAIAKSNILFWSRLWRRNSPFNPPTPEGGLILQWIITVILISASSAIGSLNEALPFPGLIYIYAQGLIGGINISKFELFRLMLTVAVLVFVGCGFVLLKYREFPLPKRRHGEDWTSSDEFKILESLWSKVLLAIIFVMFNLAILIIPLIPPYRDANGSSREILGWYYIVILSVVVLVAIIYYFAIHNRKWSILTLGGARPEIVTFKEHNETYGNRREVQITTVSLLLPIV